MVFKHLEEANLKIKLSQFQFFKKHLHYLGHLISKHVIQPLPKKYQQIKKLKEPNNIDDLCHFLGPTGCYRKFIQLFANVIKPVNKLLRRTPSFHGQHNARLILNTLRKHFARNLYSNIPIWKNHTPCLLTQVTMPALESSLWQLTVLKI